VAAHLVSGNANGEQLLSVVAAFCVEHPDFEKWAQAKTARFPEMTEKQKSKKLGDLDASIAKAQAQLRDAEKAAAIAAVEARYAEIDVQVGGPAW